MTSDVLCPNCGRKLLVDWELVDATSVAGSSEFVWCNGNVAVIYTHKLTCPLCGAELEISHTLVPHFTAEFAR